jgi:D-alanyl-D-alanine carboxypeptidase
LYRLSKQIAKPIIDIKTTEKAMKVNYNNPYKMKRTKEAISTFLAVILLFQGYAQTIDKRKLDQFFDRLSEKNKAMGSVAILKGGSIVYSRSIGFTQINANERRPATVATEYRIGSITKMFTATMIFQLIEQRKVKLSDTLGRFFPQVPNSGKITIGEMLQHRSGIHDFTEDRDYRTWKMNAKKENEIFDMISKSKSEFEPGSRFAYSNSNYVLLGYIIEKLTGKPYGKALEKRITSKLGLKNTYAGTGKAAASKNESLSFRWAGEWQPEAETELSIPGGAGSVISTPTDLCKFIQGLFGLKLISSKSLDLMKTMNNGYGMGMETLKWDDQILYGHTGGIDEFHSLLFYRPEEKVAIAFTANGVDVAAADIFNGVLDIYYGKPFQIPSFETVEVSPEVLDTYVGVYSSSELPMKFRISRTDKTLLMKGDGPSVVPLEATAQDKFKVERAGIVLEFDAAKNQMIFKRAGRERVFRKVFPPL